MPREMMPFVLAMLLLAIGIYAIVAKKNVIKIIIGVIIMEYAVNLFLILVGYKEGGVAPILVPPADMANLPQVQAEFIQRSVDPLPQALVLTSIVIGLSTLALMVGIAVRLYERYGTFDVSKIRKLRG